MAFKPNNQCYGHHHAIVCDNVPLFVHTCVSWQDKQCWRRKFSTLLHEKIIFHFLNAPKVGFVKHLPRICWKFVKIYFIKIIEHFLCTNNQLVTSESFSCTSHEKDKFLPIQLEISKFELEVLHSLLKIFQKKSFLGSKDVVSSEIR